MSNRDRNQNERKRTPKEKTDALSRARIDERRNAHAAAWGETRATQRATERSRDPWRPILGYAEDPSAGRASRGADREGSGENQSSDEESRTSR